MPVIKDRIRQLYQFLREATQLRFRPVRTVDEQPKVIRLANLPNHPAMQLFRPVRGDDDQEVSDTLLRVKRPTLTKCPQPPTTIASWLVPGWDDPNKAASVVESQNTLDDERRTITIRFDEDQQRTSDLQTWLQQRVEWTVPELVARKAMSFFEVMYDVYSTIEKDREGLELLATDGHLLWQATSDNDGSVAIRHPILLKRVELRFDPTGPEFTIHDTDRESEIYSSLFADLRDIAPAALRSRKAELENGKYHPFGWEDTDAFLRAFILSISPLAGEYLDEVPSGGATQTPTLFRDMALVLRKRVAGIANAVDAIIDDIERQTIFPPALAQITGAVAEREGGEPDGDGGQAGAWTGASLDEDDILLSEKANKEQLQIIRRLERSGSVIVQGPPGTGKTHTIGNLIGHLLAQGKSILVTAQTAKALRVVRDKVPEMLRPLTVSVLGSDQDARRQLESSVNTITQRLTGDSAQDLGESAQRFEAERRTLLTEARQLAHTLRQALENEYREIVVGERRFSPSHAARHVSEHRASDDWIPTPIKLGERLSVSDQELVRLYALGDLFSVAEERDTRLPLPDLALLPSERQFQIMVSEYRHLTTTDLSHGAERWQSSGRSSDSLEVLINELAGEFSDDLRQQTWRPHAIVAGIHGGTERDVWKSLIAGIEAAVEANSRHALVLAHNPRLSTTLPIHEQQQIAVEVLEYIDGGGRLGFVQLVTRSRWRQFIGTASVAAGRPGHRDHFEALARLAELEHLRSSLEQPWDSLIGEKTDSKFRSLGASPELSCRALISEMRRCLDWHASVWLPLAKRLKEEGLKVDELLASMPREVSQTSEYVAIERLASMILPPMLAGELGRRKLRECEVGFDRLNGLATQCDPTAPDRGCIGRITSAVRARSAESYAEALEYSRRLHVVQPLVAERDALARKLGLVAPTWAEQIIQRIAPHHEGTIPGNSANAWVWRQLHDTLAEHDKLDPEELQDRIDQVRDRLREVTRSLIDARAWGKQLERLHRSPSIRQALVGWVDTIRRLNSTRQLNQRQILLSAARKLMKDCASAVPVWVMPISIMAESLDSATRFDVVIVDEASQADLNALIPLYLAKQVIVVGDHEQVTPLGVGANQATLSNLVRSMLQGIPNSHLFDNMSSIYDIGRQSFGDAIRLVEHFRCVPEIIAFSNKLSYEGQIKPLREANSTDIKPACVACRVEGVREGKTNQGEARRIVDTIKAMIRHPLYANKTIGIISMLGNEQPLLIETVLRREVPVVEIEKRRIQAGISGEFQGDERDIIFLSLVDSSPGEGPLRRIGDGAFELIKKRYNVAASRARDQLWVMHSFDPDLHMRTGDLRGELLRHVRNPTATMRSFAQGAQRADSPFEVEVLRLLTGAGYRVKSQWQAGYFRIDMVVEGGGKRLAIECDGDRFHPLEKLAEDMERQSILERLGWKFVRIRGSAFYRDKESAMRPVFDRLRELEIPPEGGSDEPEAVDMTLIHELDELIQSETEASVPEDPVLREASSNGQDSESRGAEGSSATQDTFQIEEFLRSRGGTLPLEVLLRNVAIARGFQRLGSNIRRNLEIELEALRRLGRLRIMNGFVQLC